MAIAPASSHQCKGVSLLELAIVIAIFALVIAAITGGQILVKQSELRSVISDIERYTEAVTMFENQYNYLPGDFPEAEDYWGADDSCPNTATNTTHKAVTCDGDGDGRVYDVPAGTERYETFRFWQHLSNAGFIEGSFTGVTGPDNAYDSVLDINSPSSQITGGGYSFFYLGYVGASNTGDMAAAVDGILKSHRYNHVFLFGSDVGGDVELTGMPVLTPRDAYAIDSKVDDGNPSWGNVMSMSTGVQGCGDGLGPNKEYENLSSDDAISCQLLFLTAF